MNYEDCLMPGHLITKLLDERGWNQQFLAAMLNVSKSIVSKMISGVRPVDAEMALLLGEIFNVDPEIFLRLQQSYDLAKARISTQPDPSRAFRAQLYANLPINEMIKRRWLDADSSKDLSQVESSLKRFFQTSSLEDIEILPHAAKKTQVATEVTPAQLAWIYRVRQIAEEMVAAQYSEFAVRSAIKRLESLLSAPEEIRKAPRILAECGVRFVIVETISSAKIDGVCLWLNETSPVIGMTLRYDRIDNFWFVLRHEIEHVLRYHGRGVVMLDTELEGERAGTGADVSDEERQANEAAADFGVSREMLNRFIRRKSPFFKESDILGFARTLQVHPGIVVGRLQHATGRYDLLREHLVKVRTKIAPGAMVDGWGDVAPVGF